MELHTDTRWAGYTEAQTGAAVYVIPQPGYLHIGGPDRAVYIQRQTTNDVGLLAPGRSVPTVLTSGTARTLDVWRLLSEADPDTIGVITLPGRGGSTARYLQSRIFFMDKVTLVDRSSDVAQIEVVGPAAPDLLGTVPEVDQVIDTAIGGVDARLIGLGDDAYLLITAAGQGDSLVSYLGAARLSEAARETLRIEAGRPGPARELTSDYTPLEANLDRMVSSTKGCYSGQEVIARQINYDKIARRLVGLRLDAPVTVGAGVQVEGRTAGSVTSAAESPRFGSIALAVLRRPYFEPGVAVTVAGDGPVVAGQTVGGPFES